MTPHSIPFQAGLLMTLGSRTGLCGGSVLSSTWILTAAHCPINSDRTQVILGAHQITSVEENQQRFEVLPENYRIHEEYNPSNLNNDLALLLLPREAIINNDFVAVSNLPTLGRSDSFVGDLATISGWGRTSDSSGATSAFLRSAQNNIISNIVCEQTFGSIIVDSTICKATIGVQGGCNGDSGGPLTIVENAATLQIGVVSFGSNAGCELNFPSGFARVTSFRQWIETTSGV